MSLPFAVLLFSRSKKNNKKPGSGMRNILKLQDGKIFDQRGVKALCLLREYRRRRSLLPPFRIFCGWFLPPANKATLPNAGGGDGLNNDNNAAVRNDENGALEPKQKEAQLGVTTKAKSHLSPGSSKQIHALVLAASFLLVGLPPVLSQDDGGNSNGDQEKPKPEDWAALRTTLILYGSMFAGIAVLFCLLRQKFPSVYNVRKTGQQRLRPTCEIAEGPHGLISWTWKVLSVKDDEIFDKCGVDALCLLRIFRLGFKLSLVGIFCSWFLLPVYITSDPGDKFANITDVAAANSTDMTNATVGEVLVAVDPWLVTTASNLAIGSNRIYAITVASYVLFGSAMLLVWKELKYFTKIRAKYLSLKKPRSYTVLVNGIPRSRRSNAALAAYFRRVFSEEAVVEANVVLSMPRLESLVKERDAARFQLEHAKAIRDVQGVAVPMQTVVRADINAVADFGRNKKKKKKAVERVPAIEYFREELAKLDDEIATLRSNIQQSRFAADQAFPENLRPSSPWVSGGTSDDAQHQAPDDDAEESSDDAPSEKNVIESNHHSNTNPAASIRSSTKSAAENVFSASRDVVGTAEHVYNKSADVVGIGGRIVGLQKKIDEGTPRSAGFVTFDKLSTVSAACQMIHTSHPSGMRVEGTPPPEALVWDNLGMADSVLQARRLISLTATATVCLFWTIPVSFLVSLTQPVALAQYFPKAKSAFLAHPGLASFLNQLGPLLLQLMNNVVLPELMKFFAKYEGGIGESRVLASMATKMAAFKIVQVFFVSSIAGGLIQGLSQFKTVGDVFRYLAATLPPQSEFFIQIILIDSVLVLGLELVRTTALIKAGLRKCIGPRLTEKEREMPYMTCRSFSNPRDFLFPHIYSTTTLHFMILFVFTIIAPIIAYVMAFSFLVMEVGNRHQFFYIYPSTPDSGGIVWMRFIGTCLCCMPIAESILLVALGLGQAVGAFFMFVPLLVATILFVLYVRLRYHRICLYLPSENCAESDARNSREDDDFGFLKHKYLQPALKDDSASSETQDDKEGSFSSVIQDGNSSASIVKDEENNEANDEGTETQCPEKVL